MLVCDRSTLPVSRLVACAWTLGVDAAPRRWWWVVSPVRPGGSEGEGIESSQTHTHARTETQLAHLAAAAASAGGDGLPRQRTSYRRGVIAGFLWSRRDGTQVGRTCSPRVARY